MQRFVIRVLNNGVPIACLYHKRGADTPFVQSQCELLRNVLATYGRNKCTDPVLACIRFAEIQGGCIDGGEHRKEYQKVSALYPNEKFRGTCLAKNESLRPLVAITPEGMDELILCAEKIVDLEIGKKGKGEKKNG